MGDEVDLLERPVYGFRQTDRVLGLGAGTTKRWVDGYTRSGRLYEPVVRERPTGGDLITWGEFVEVGLLAQYRDARVPMSRLRPTVVRLRREFGLKYPLAHARVWLEPSGRELVRKIQGDDRPKDQFTVYRTGQEQLSLSAGAQTFVDAVSWEPSVDRFARALRPLPEVAEVICDPLRRVGEPTIKGNSMD